MLCISSDKHSVLSQNYICFKLFFVSLIKCILIIILNELVFKGVQTKEDNNETFVVLIWMTYLHEIDE